MVDHETVYRLPLRWGLGKPVLGKATAVQTLMNFSGSGYLAGEFPEGITAIEGVPGPADIRVLYRTGHGHVGDGTLVAETKSAPDGTWIIQNLNPDLKYDVVCRHEDYNDMILSNVSPAVVAPAEPTSLTFRGNLVGLGSFVRILHGIAPYEVQIVSGTVPDGVGFQVVSNYLEFVGSTDEVGMFEFVLRVTDGVGLPGVIAGSVDIDDGSEPEPETGFRSATFRLLITANSENDPAFAGSVAQMRLLDADGNNVAVAGVATASTIYDATFSADKAFDGYANTMWASSSGAFPAWLQYQLPAEATVRQLVIMAGDSSVRAGRAPRTFVLQAEREGQWEAILTRENETGWQASESRTFDITTLLSGA